MINCTSEAFSYNIVRFLGVELGEEGLYAHTLRFLGFVRTIWTKSFGKNILIRNVID